MADGHGGPRTPAHPAPVSPPGAMSRRTDGGPGAKQPQQSLPNAKYGEASNFQSIEQGAGMAGNPVTTPPANVPPAPAPPAPTAVPLSAPTQRPDEPVTAGSPVGPGIGPTAAGIDTRSIQQQDAEALAPYLPMLEYMANQPGAMPSSRAFVRQIRGAQ